MFVFPPIWSKSPFCLHWGSNKGLWSRTFRPLRTPQTNFLTKFASKKQDGKHLTGTNRFFFFYFSSFWKETFEIFKNSFLAVWRFLCRLPYVNLQRLVQLAVERSWQDALVSLFCGEDVGGGGGGGADFGKLLIDVARLYDMLLLLWPLMLLPTLTFLWTLFVVDVLWTFWMLLMLLLLLTDNVLSLSMISTLALTNACSEKYFETSFWLTLTTCWNAHGCEISDLLGGRYFLLDLWSESVNVP